MLMMTLTEVSQGRIYGARAFPGPGIVVERVLRAPGAPSSFQRVSARSCLEGRVDPWGRVSLWHRVVLTPK